jgi:hypothetical protein
MHGLDQIPFDSFFLFLLFGYYFRVVGCHFWGDEGVATLEGGTWSIGPLPSPPAISSLT